MLWVSFFCIILSTDKEGRKKEEEQGQGLFWTLSKLCKLPWFKKKRKVIFFFIVILPRSARQATLTIPISAKAKRSWSLQKSRHFDSAAYWRRYTRRSSIGAEGFTIHRNPPPPYVTFTDYNRVRFKGPLILPNLVMSPTLLQEMNAAARVCAGLLAGTGCSIVIDAVI